jgi:hypothetical protein
MITQTFVSTLSTSHPPGHQRATATGRRADPAQAHWRPERTPPADVAPGRTASGHLRASQLKGPSGRGFDRSGEVARVSVHTDYRAVITANGHTIVERDKWMDVFNADGTARTVGDTVHIQGPAGMVQHDAGQIVFNSDGSVAAIHGPHPQFEGQTFCFALLP